MFQSLKIIDLSTVLAGPSVGSFFAELGAEVIKIENPKSPDVTRLWKLPSEEKESPVSAYFSSVNYRKKYQKLDLLAEPDKEKLWGEIATADIVLMNFKKGSQEKLGLSDKKLRSINPRLIIGKINGFGTESNRVAYDLILQAETGLMSMNGTPESGAVKMPVAFVDVLAAHHLKEGLLLELIQREREKEYSGKTISVSLYDAAISSLVNQASNYLMENHIPKRIGSLHPNIAPYGELFLTSDRKTITFAIGNNAHFKIFCFYFGLTNLFENERFSTVQNRVKYRNELFEILKEKVIQFSSEEILAFMHSHFVPCGLVKNLAEVFQSHEAQKMIREEEIEGKLTRRVSNIAFKVE